MPTEGPARFGKNPPAGCECDYHFTCRVCLAQAATRAGLMRPAASATVTDDDEEEVTA